MEPLTGRTPREQNRVPATFGVSSADGTTALPIEINPSTGRLLVDSTGGGGGGDVQYTDGAVSPAHPIGTIPVFDNAGTITAVSAANPLPVNASVTVSGVSTAANQTNGNQKTQVVDGSGNVIGSTSNALDINIKSGNISGFATSALQTTGNTSLASIDGKITAVNTGAVVISSSVLPTGAATAAKQPALGTAGTASADVITVQGKSGMTALVVDGSGSTQPVSGTVAASQSGTWTVQPGNTANTTAWKVDGSAVTQPVSGTVTANAGTNLNTSALALETGGNLATLAGAVTSSVVQSNVKQINGVTPLMGNGTTGTGSQRVTIASDNTAFSVNAVQSGTWTVQPGNTANTTAWKVDGSAVTQPVSYATTGSGTATGALRVEVANNGTGILATVGAVTAITNALPAGTNNIGQVSVAPQTANGLSVFNATSSDGATALTSTAQAVKASAGQLYGWYIYNPNATAQFVQLYNTAAASVTVGTTNPLFMLTIPATSGANVEFTNGITFSNAGWSAAATATAGGNGAPGTALDAVFFYK